MVMQIEFAPPQKKLIFQKNWDSAATDPVPQRPTFTFRITRSGSNAILLRVQVDVENFISPPPETARFWSG